MGAMIAATVFFFAEAGTVSSHWKTTLHMGGLVTLVAGVHYMYMREYWVQVHKSPIVYRYVDWSITVPLQMIEFNLILKAAGKETSSGMFWKLLLGTVVMLLCGYLGEIAVLPAPVAWLAGLSFCSKSSLAKPVALCLVAARLFLVPSTRLALCSPAGLQPRVIRPRKTPCWLEASA